MQVFPEEKFSGNRKVCRSCRCKQRNPKTVRSNSLRAWRKKYSENKEAWNLKVREYRAKRRTDGNPIKRQIPTDKLRKSGRFKIWQRKQVHSIYGEFCMYCLKPSDTIDHVVSLKAGGDNEINNLVPACWSCNSSKQDRGLLIWAASKRRINL